MISHNPRYMGEARLGHYRLSNAGFSREKLWVPKDPEKLQPEFWYAVTRGRSIGIYLTW